MYGTKLFLSGLKENKGKGLKKQKKKKKKYYKKVTDSGTYVPIMQHLKLAFVITIHV